MEAGKPSLFAALTQRLQHLAGRTSVIAENIANADTPGYVARDVARPDFARLAAGAALKVSDPRHIAAPAAGPQGAKTVLAPDGEASLSGNQVSIETQMMKLAETRMDYQLASTVYRKGVELIRLAARGGR
jgi:flagellar basal-body rod protein FlgB